MGILATSRLDSKAPIEVCDVLSDEGVGSLHSGDVIQTQFFDEPVLKGRVDALDATFGLGGC